jgi:hypothetical protein
VFTHHRANTLISATPPRCVRCGAASLGEGISAFTENFGDTENAGKRASLFPRRNLIIQNDLKKRIILDLIYKVATQNYDIRFLMRCHTSQLVACSL